VTSGFAPGTHLVLEKRKKLSLHCEEPFLVRLFYEIAVARVAFKFDGHVVVLGHFNNFAVKNVRWIFRAANPHKSTLTIGTARMRDAAEPSAVLTEHAYRVKVEAAMEHGDYAK
jgi:hypothetical protein